jgi:hypothetical protein
VLTGARAVVDRWCNDEEDQWWLEVAARAKECARAIRSEGERGGEGRGCSVTAGGNGSVIALTPLKAGAG